MLKNILTVQATHCFVNFDDFATYCIIKKGTVKNITLLVTIMN